MIKMLMFDFRNSEKDFFLTYNQSDFDITFKRESLNENTKLTAKEKNETFGIKAFIEDCEVQFKLTYRRGSKPCTYIFRKDCIFEEFYGIKPGLIERVQYAQNMFFNKYGKLTIICDGKSSLSQFFNIRKTICCVV